MRRTIVGILSLFIFLMIGSPCSYAQLAPKTDSLKVLLQQSDGKQRIELLLELSDQIQRSNIDTALSYAEEALAVSQQYGDEQLQAESRRKFGRLLSLDGQHPEGLEQLLNAEELFENIGALQKKAVTLENIGALYSRQNDYPKALEYYYRALDIREQLNNQGNVARTLLNIGVVHEALNQPERSAEFYSGALKISEEKSDISSIAIIATQMGNLYDSMGKTDEGIRYMNQALEASKKLPGEHARATILLAVSSMYKGKESYEQALDANMEALTLADKLESKSLKILAQKNIAAIYIEQNDYQTAQKYLMQSIQSLEEGGSQQQIIDTRNLLAKNYFMMGDYTQSVEEGQQALEAATKAKAFELGLESLRILTDVYEQTGDYQKATSGYKKITAFKDSIYNAEQVDRIAEMQTRYETEQKEQEIAQLKEEHEQERLLRNAFAAGLVLILIIGILIFNRQKLKINKNRTELENTLLKEQQLEQDLEFKNRELTTHTLHLVQKNETMKELKENIGEIKQKENGDLHHDLQKLENMVDYSFNLDDDWEQFQLYFEEVHTGFFDTLREQYPDLTPNELRLAALAKLNLSVKETATIMGITPDSVKTARYRLRKKLDMETEENLTEFMMEVEKEGMG